MSEERKSEDFMLKLARFIVDKRKAFYLVFLAAVLFCAASVSKVHVNNDITSYLPADTETRRGLTLMEEEFTTLGSGQFMLTNITYDEADQVAKEIEHIDGVSGVEFDDTEKHYTGSSALITVTFDGEKDDPVALQAMDHLKSILAPYDTYIYSEVGLDTSAQLQSEMGIILVIAAIVIVIVLLFTSKSYMEVPVYVIVFGVAAVLNMGTNYWFGEVSYITNSVAIVLQLALAIDYAIIFCHRYMEERETKPAREADIAALSKAIVEISSSSLTTISGMIALMLMQFRIGFDMGAVMSKGIICSMLTVFLLMPGLLMLFSNGIERTRHPNLVPRISLVGKAVVKLRYILPPIFLVTIIAGIFLSGKCDYCFSENVIDTNNPPEQRIALDRISDTFGNQNTIALLVPKGDYEKEGKILAKISELPEIDRAQGLANTEAEGYMLTDKLKPRQFAEIAGVDIEMARLLYQAYGLEHEEYGAIFQNPDDYEIPLVDSFQFLCEQKDKGVIKLEGEQAEMVDDLQEQLDIGLPQLQGEHWSRLVFIADVPEESPQTFALLDQMRAIAAQYYGDDVLLVGNSTNARDLSESFSGDNLKISVLTALFVMIILLFTFKSAGLPILLVLTIQGSIWINFSFPYLTHTNLFFLSYLVVSSIQMGATIDYAIVITNRYMELKTIMSHRDAVIETLNQSFPTILTSGSIMTASGFLIGMISTNPPISSLGLALGRGTLTSIFLVMTVLPQLLILGDTLIERTAITLNIDRKQRFSGGIMHVDGHIRGHVSGFVDGEIRGLIRGDINAMIESKKPIKKDPADPESHTEEETSK
ncbi:RND transporter [Butyricicoccus pullicaecorum]|uniref:RND transporter n=1 Tax=Butyricicoccus pullicaecorum TaxID=501571 RepID=A0A1Y4LCM9_9FIRM|nr:MMPL family transporter [Butyricicoccus pullicaecorum]OUP52581.1 RND transporter [Butyricicoccus pullicaecorum]